MSFKPLNKKELEIAVNNWILPFEDPNKDSSTYIGFPISEWNTSLITDMSNLFKNKTTFNDDINNWDVSNVSNMKSMFESATSFNQDLSNWNTLNVNNMVKMFSGAINFNQSLQTWNVSNISNNIDNNLIRYIRVEKNNAVNGNWYMHFGELEAYNENNINVALNKPSSASSEDYGGLKELANNGNTLGTWTPSNVLIWHSSGEENPWWEVDLGSEETLTKVKIFNRTDDYTSLLNGSEIKLMTSNREVIYTFTFNYNWEDQNDPLNLIQEYIVSNTINSMEGMLDNTINSMEGMLDNTALSVNNYNLTLNEWSSQAVQSNVTLGAQGLKYSSVGEIGRNKLINDYEWHILGDSNSKNNSIITIHNICVPPTPELSITTKFILSTIFNDYSSL